MRRLAIDGFEEPDEMKFRKTGLVGDIVKIDRRRILRVDKKLCLHDAAVQILAGICVHATC